MNIPLFASSYCTSSTFHAKYSTPIELLEILMSWYDVNDTIQKIFRNSRFQGNGFDTAFGLFIIIAGLMEQANLCN